ncbi:response regulator transcription factor [Amycolatopsis sp. H20-H5]|uniref:response regulator transcription factor n=1 Tax=Amycolatopsis sp. H20-H5 TaxID=3046309 RepID=UPI002DBEDB44|nr:response regulator transcription factor [Amycolatopsis sp. H20-H5]MEC3975532.1 response regulator transcription factor [Amycolatopsis sp. H20-H5]
MEALADAGREQVPRGRILVVDDDVSVAATLFTTLRFLGFDVATARTGRKAIRMATSARPDVVVLEVALPDVSGFDVYESLRGASVTAPVLFLSKRRSTDDLVKGLALGGDDFVCKPFEVEELVARVEVLLRRGAQPRAFSRRLRVGRLELDRSTRDVWKDGAVIRLSTTEFEVLEYLMVRAGTPVSKSELLAGVWGYAASGDFGVVETYVYYLRRKLGESRETFISTTRNVGYVLGVRQ